MFHLCSIDFCDGFQREWGSQWSKRRRQRDGKAQGANNDIHSQAKWLNDVLSWTKGQREIQWLGQHCQLQSLAKPRDRVTSRKGREGGKHPLHELPSVVPHATHKRSNVLSWNKHGATLPLSSDKKGAQHQTWRQAALSMEPNVEWHIQHGQKLESHPEKMGQGSPHWAKQTHRCSYWMFSTP